MSNGIVYSPEEQIFLLLQELIRMFRHHTPVLHTNFGELTHLQLHALFLIRAHQPVRMAKLALDLHMSAPSATALVERLVASGWTKRTPDPLDRRVVQLSLTNHAEHVLYSFHKQKAARFKQLLAHLTPDDTKQLIRILTIITNAANKEAHAS